MREESKYDADDACPVCGHSVGEYHFDGTCLLCWKCHSPSGDPR